MTAQNLELIGEANCTHTWRTRSRHQILAGRLLYQHCGCGQWRVMVMTGADDVELAQTGSPSAVARNE
jgi:hypothetical protein